MCRAEGLQKEVKATLRSKFSCIRSYKLEQDVNEVLFCSTKVQKDKEALRSEVKSAAQNFNSIVKDNKIQSRNVVDVTDLVKKLNIS